MPSSLTDRIACDWRTLTRVRVKHLSVHFHILALPPPLAVDVFEDSIYWTSERGGTLTKAHKMGIGNAFVFHSGLNQPGAFRIVHKYRKFILITIAHSQAFRR